MATRRKTTKNAVEIIDRRFFKTKKARVELDEARSSAQVARQIHRLRTDAGLSQRQLAGLVGTTASVICRLENDDYEGHSLTMLRRLAAALGKRVEIRFVRTQH